MTSWGFGRALTPREPSILQLNISRDEWKRVGGRVDTRVKPGRIFYLSSGTKGGTCLPWLSLSLLTGEFSERIC